jgi:hypothetical protein
MASIEELKGAITAGSGPAQGHQYLVQLPAIPGSALDASRRNALCKATRLPGRQIATMDRNVGLINQKIANGHATADVTLSFHLLNDYATRSYFDTWQNLIVDQRTQQISYADNYKFPVKIYQLTKGSVFRTMDLLDASFGFRFGAFGISFDLDVDATVETNKVYGVELEKAFPVTLNGIDLNDAMTDQLLEVSVDLSYMNWRKI